MNSTQKLGSGRPERRAREDWRGLEPGEAEEGIEMDQETDQQMLDSRVQCLYKHCAFVIGEPRKRIAILVLLPPLRARGSPVAGEPMTLAVCHDDATSESQSSVPLVVV